MLPHLFHLLSMRVLLLALLVFPAFSACAQAGKASQLTRQDPAQFKKLMTDFEATEAGRLLRLYRPYAKLTRVQPNAHAAGRKDSLLTVKTSADHLYFLTNRDKTLLLGATITSTKVSFGGVKIGAAKAAFCRSLHLSPAYTRYVFQDGEENFLQLTFSFTANKLARVEYKMLYSLEEID